MQEKWELEVNSLRLKMEVYGEDKCKELVYQVE